ncbi:MAG: M48 family metallopeptidase [Verrucomicrobiota bacterium]
MDFFEHQDQARKRTRKLVIYFCISVILTILAVYALCALSLGYAASTSPDDTFRLTKESLDLRWLDPLTDQLPLDPDLILIVFTVTGAIIFLGSSMKTYQLAQGGKAIAIMLGGQRVQPNTDSPQERQLLNIVEEMSIASGCPVPEVYLLKQERGINAFAAGFTTADATIGVTRGTMELLQRDELQGVIAHEFSHILNGDMRLNMQMTCLTHGILFIAEAGIMLIRLPFRVAFYAGSSRSSKKSGMPFQLILGMLAAGVIMALVGSIGYFFAQLIKSAVSRQREFLADAAAVQFTRNPEGIGMALKKIGGLSNGSAILSSQNAEASHFFFANGLASSWFELFASHPPLIERISILDPSFDGTFPQVSALRPEPIDQDGSYHKKQREREGIFTEDSGDTRVAGLVASAGHLTPAAIVAASQLTGALPRPLYQASHEPFGACAVAYSLLLSQDPAVLQYQQNLLQQHADPAVLAEMQKLKPESQQLRPRQRLVLLDLTIPALRQLSPEQYQVFRTIVSDLAAADQGISLFEYCLEKVLLRHLDPAFNPVNARRPSVRSLIPVWQECMQLLGALAYLDSETYQEAQAAFEAGASQLNLGHRKAELLPQEEVGLAQVDAALNACGGLTPMYKRNLLFACSQVILKFRGCSEEEVELIRAIADTLDCPLPPFIAEQMV